MISGALLALSILGFILNGLNFSIDFEGGAQITYTFVTPVDAEQVQNVLQDHGIDDAEVQIVNGDSVAIRAPSLEGEGEQGPAAIRRDLAEQAGIDPVDVSIEDIGPTWGAEISKKAGIGLFVVLAAITLYITIRFEWKMAIGAMIALVHDVVITVGVYALVGREVTPETVIAVLTILGYSLYDTVVIYDKIKENLESQSLVARLGSDGVIDLSLNQVLMRSVNTSLVVLLPILSLLLFGGDTLKDFAFAMFVGVAIGAYSSIFIAAPILALLKRREQRYRQLEQRRTDRERVVAKRATAAATVTPGAGVGEAAAARATVHTGTASRPRPKSKRKPPAKRKRR
jgi:preprotein translocase subunit SecF